MLKLRGQDWAVVPLMLNQGTRTLMIAAAFGEHWIILFVHIALMNRVLLLNPMQMLKLMDTL